MTDTHTDPAQAVSQLGESLAQASESHRVLVQEMTLFARDESLRFANLRLERNGAALDRLQTCAGLPGLIGVQQEWLRELVQDYMGQNMRVAGALRGLSRNAVASAAEAASDTIDRVQHEAGEMAHQSAEMAQQTGEQAEQDVNHHIQEPLH